MHRLNRLTASLLVAALVAVAGCTTERAPTAPPPDASLIGDLIETTETTLGQAMGLLLLCTPEPSVSATQTIGPRGGTITVGRHTLEIPARALPRPVTITATTASGPVRSVAFQPHGLEFAKPATLTLSYHDCALAGTGPKRIAYVSNLFEILYYLRSRDDAANQRVSGRLDHFSQYAVAW